jgi:hypothetical protein
MRTRKALFEAQLLGMARVCRKHRQANEKFRDDFHAIHCRIHLPALWVWTQIVAYTR